MDVESVLCACGCGRKASRRSNFAYKHWVPANPRGFCLCGCGQKTPLAESDRKQRGYLKGDPMLYVLGHQVGSGTASPRWKGGRWIHKSGYVYLYVPEHPRANRDGYVLEHRLIAEQMLGRLLRDEEIVHHRNGIRSDNRRQNLVVLQTTNEHSRLHAIETFKTYFETHDQREHSSRVGKKGAAARWGKKP